MIKLIMNFYHTQKHSNTLLGGKKKTMKNSAASCLCVLYLIDRNRVTLHGPNSSLTGQDSSLQPQRSLFVEASGGEVTGSGNDILHVPCTYSVHGGKHPMCWGRGGCPLFGCNDEIIWTDGQQVTWRKSDRYQLLGNIGRGDVSLTITGATKKDERTYCCRVEIPGPFNDKKTEMKVTMEEVLTVSEDVRGSVNDTLTLPCTYTPHTDPPSMCWGRGECSEFGCREEIIKTNGQNVTDKKSDRYQLLGNIRQGDVSLTITGATKEDGGTYCCHVEITGQFMKKKVEMKIQEAYPVSTSQTSNPHTPITTTRQSMHDTYNDPHNPVTLTAWRPSVTSQETTLSELSQSTSSTNIVIPGIVGTLLLMALMGILIYIYKFRREKKTQTESASVVNLEALSEPGHETTDNIYT